MITVMSWLLYVALMLSIGHFVYESILAPNLRLEIRNELFKIKDELESMPLNELNENDKAVYFMLYSSINELMVRLPKINLSLLKEVKRTFELNEKFRERVLKKRAIFNATENKQLKNLDQRANKIFSNAFLINSGAWAMWLVPILVMIMLFTKVHRIIAGVVTLKKDEIQKFIPETEDELLCA